MELHAFLYDVTRRPAMFMVRSAQSANLILTGMAIGEAIYHKSEQSVSAKLQLGFNRRYAIDFGIDENHVALHIIFQSGGFHQSVLRFGDLLLEYYERYFLHDDIPSVEMTFELSKIDDFRSFLPVLRASPKRFGCQSAHDVSDIIFGMCGAFGFASSENPNLGEDRSLLSLTPSESFTKYYVNRVRHLEAFVTPQSMLSVPYGESELGAQKLFELFEEYYESPAFKRNK